MRISLLRRVPAAEVANGTNVAEGSVAYIVWSEAYSVGVEALDADHIIMVSLINHLHDAREQGRDPAVLGSILGALINYIDTHFEREEAMMRDAGYPELERQRAEHRELARRVEELRRAYRKQGDEDLTDKVLALMEGWLTDHILEVDMRYRDFFRALGA